MPKFKNLIFAILLSIIVFQPLISRADGVANVSFQPTVPQDFNDVIVVHIYSDYIPGYNETIDKTIELTPTMMYISAIEGIPAGNYFAELSTYRNGDPSKTPYTNPDYTLDYTRTFQLLSGQNYDYKINFTPSVQRGTETSPPAITAEPGTAAAILGTDAPTPAPTPKNSVIWPFVTDFFRRNWFTIALIIIAGGILAFITIRKTIYKE